MAPFTNFHIIYSRHRRLTSLELPVLAKWGDLRWKKPTIWPSLRI